jgi:hypothetical protein
MAAQRAGTWVVLMAFLTACLRVSTMADYSVETWAGLMVDWKVFEMVVWMDD